MFIPLIIPTSVKTNKQSIIDTQNTPYLGGYLILFMVILPPFIVSFILGLILSSIKSIFYEFLWTTIFFLTGIFMYYWDRWLRLYYDTEIKLLFIPVEYISYAVILSILIFVFRQ